LKEAFEVFCNKIVAGCSSAELLASYCDNILKKGGSEKLSDDAIEETLDKVALTLYPASLSGGHSIFQDNFIIVYISYRWSSFLRISVTKTFLRSSTGWKLHQFFF